MNRVVLGPDLDDTRRTIERARAVTEPGLFVRRSTFVRGRHVRARVGVGARVGEDGDVDVSTSTSASASARARCG